MISRKTGSRTSVLTAPQGVSRKNFNINRGGKLDRDADQWARRHGIKSPLEIERLNRYIKGIKKIGLWDMGLISYPLGLLQNSASTVIRGISKTGNYQGTITGAVTRLRTGLFFGNQTGRYVDLNHAFPYEDDFYFGVVAKTSSFSLATQIAVIDTNGVILVLFTNNPASSAKFATDENDQGADRLTINVGSPSTGPKFMQFYYEGPDASYGGKINTGAVTMAATSLVNWINEPGNIRLSSSSNGFFGEISFFVISPQIPSEDQMQSLYSLYRSSLGIGLGLP